MDTDSLLLELGLGEGATAAPAVAVVEAMRRGHTSRKAIRATLREVCRRPERYADDALLGPLARAIQQHGTAEDRAAGDELALRETMVPHAIWGRELMEPDCLKQFETACRLPVAVRGAQMPDGHVGYGLPIGGVLATRGVVIPYAVGVDIACRMRLSVYAEPLSTLTDDRNRLKSALVRETKFGVGAHWDADERRLHDVLDDPAWDEVPMLGALKAKAFAQLGTSGSGNHFVEFGELTVDEHVDELDLGPGCYLALLSHSGSRGLGADVAAWYTGVARRGCRLPDAAKHLAWLDLDSADGREYWTAMNLCGRYAAANHELIHREVTKSAKLTTVASVENHHNFAWREEHDGEELIVHRKGATPAGFGVLGIIPGSMGDPGFVVRGLGCGASLDSAAHGAGRVMSRAAAHKRLTTAQRAAWLKEKGVELLAGGIDESPQVYKRIQTVMDAQRDLVKPLAAFMPRLVLMARGGRAED